MKKQEVITEVAEKESKYFDLVWYARKSPEHYDLPKVKEKIDEIEKLYSLETKQLQGEDGDWSHGFNSGMLAGMRYVLSLYDLGKEHAEEEFPFLDT